MCHFALARKRNNNKFFPKMFEPDDDDFMPSSSANLSSIFDASLPSDNGANLSYTAPKQPKPLGSASVASPDQNLVSKGSVQSQSSVILAKVITLWKLENGQNQMLGKHIVAVIGNAGQQLYEVIVYQEKTNILIRQPLNDTLILYKYPKNFIGIYDSHKQFWNLSFDTLENQDSFLKEVSTHRCQIIEQKSQTSTNDQVDHRIDNINISKGSVKGKKTEPIVNEQSPIDDKDTKDKILSRITKMGRQILPKTAVERKTSMELSDSETESSYSDPILPKPTTAPRKFRRNPNHEKALSTPIMTEGSILHSSYTPNSNQMFSNNNQMVLNPHGVVYSQPYPDYGVSNFIVSQNAELKANLAEINLKLNTVLSSQGGGVDKNGNCGESDNLKSKVKCLNLKIENLTTDLERSRCLLKDLRKKYDLKCLEVMREQEKNDSQKNISKEVNRLKGDLCNMEALQVINEQLNVNIREKDKLIEAQRTSLKNSEDYYRENQLIKENLEKEISELKLKIKELTLETKDYEEKLKRKENLSLEVQKSGLALDKDVLKKRIKETMNEAFGSIMEQFGEVGLHNFEDIQEVVLENLKKTSYSLINAIE